MFGKGEYVVYGLNGVCRVDGVSSLDMDGIPKDKQFYALLPVNQEGRIYVAVDSAQDKMRRMITKQEAEELIAKLHSIEPLQVTNDKTAEELYKRCIRQYDCTDWVRLIKCIYERRQKRMETGKKMTARDEKYMRMAEDALYSELGIALGIPKGNVVEYILSKAEPDA